MTDEKVAVVTGGNSGIGFALADRMLTENGTIHLCLACRNKGRADKARHELLHKHPGADISVVIMDTSSVKSVIEGSDIIRKKYAHIDYLYLNAGIMKVASINLAQVAAIFTGEGARILSTGEGCLNHVDNVTEEGLQEVFATNLFGHFVMVRELEDKMGSSRSSKIIWTSSQNADSNFLDLQDIQHKNGREPYGSSKYATDMLSVELNKHLNQKGIYSVTTCPGLVLSNMTFGIMASWIWTFVLPFFYFMRLFVKSLTISPYNGAESLIWSARQPNESLDPRTKYTSCCNIFGEMYIGREKLKMTDEDLVKLYNQLDGMYEVFKNRYSSTKLLTNGHAANFESNNKRHVKTETDI